MPVQVTIETASKEEAQLIARELSMRVEAHSWRGLGVIRLAVQRKQDVQALIGSVAQVCEAHRLCWARVRYGDEERVFKLSGRKAG